MEKLEKSGQKFTEKWPGGNGKYIFSVENFFVGKSVEKW